MSDDIEPIVRHYESSREEDRLVLGLGQLELVRTREIIRRIIPPPPTRVLDIGGGTGVHAAWLLDAGYDVHLVDVAPRHVARARAELAARGLTAEVGDARRLAAGDGEFDVALLLGPLYHLVERADRLTALSEARRVVRVGGVIVAAAISRFASLFDGLAREWLFDPEFRSIVLGDLKHGRHENPGDRPHWFTTAYFHRPEELRDEMTAAGLDAAEVVGVEGLAGWLGHLEHRWNDEHDRAAIVESARRVESEPSLLALSAHLLAIAAVPG